MTVNVVNHLNFRGDARAALEFYHSVFGGDLAVVTYQDANAVQNPAEAKQVMWGQVSAANGVILMAFDVPSSTPWERGANSFFVSLRGTDSKEIIELWSGLAGGATIVAPLTPTQWSPLYGMLKDRFGITWVVDVVSEYSAS